MDGNNNFWLSVIMPCHNCVERVPRLFGSIVTQDSPLDEVELIVCDDNSIDNLEQAIEPYKDKVNIKYVKTKPRKIHCPSNTRRDGFEHATGEWVTFIDDDDMFEANAFRIAKALIDRGEKHFILGSCIEYSYELNKYGSTHDTLTWLHGNFYNRQFLIDNNIYFEENLKTHEDVLFNTKIAVVLAQKGINYTIYNEVPIYTWIQRNDSYCKRGFGNTADSFIETYLDEYIYGSSQAYFEAYENDKSEVNKPSYLAPIIYSLIFSYFYYEGIKWKHKCDVDSARKVIERFLYKILYIMEIGKDDIVSAVESIPAEYCKIRKEAIVGIDNFIEQETFKDFVFKTLR